MPESVKQKVQTVSPSLHDAECAHGKLPVDTLAIEYHDETAVDDCTKKIHTDVCKPPIITVESQPELGHLHTAPEDMANCVNLTEGCAITLNSRLETSQAQELSVHNEDSMHVYAGCDTLRNSGLSNTVKVTDGGPGYMAEMVTCVSILAVEYISTNVAFLTCCVNEEGYVTGSGQTNSYGPSVCEGTQHGLEEGSDPIDTHPTIAVHYVHCVLYVSVAEYGCMPVSPVMSDHVKLVGQGNHPDKHIDGCCLSILCIEWACVSPEQHGTVTLIVVDREVSCDVTSKDGTHNQNSQVALFIGLTLHTNYLMSLTYLTVLKTETCKEGKTGCAHHLVVHTINDNSGHHKDVHETGRKVTADMHVEVIQYADQGSLSMSPPLDIVIICDSNKVQTHVRCKGTKISHHTCTCQ